MVLEYSQEIWIVIHCGDVLNLLFAMDCDKVGESEM